MRRVATRATFLFHRDVLECERAHCFAMTVGANGKLAGCGSQLPTHETAVWIMAVAALDQPNIDTMSVRAIEFRFLLCVAPITKQRLLILEQVVGLGGMVGRMAGEASDSVLEVNRATEIDVLQTAFMTLEAALACLRGRQLREANDLRRVATALNVRRSRAVAVFASMFPCLQQCEMRCPFKVLGIDLVMAALAGVGAYVGRAGNRTGHIRGSAGGMLAAVLLLSGAFADCILRGLCRGFRVIASQNETQKENSSAREQVGHSVEALGNPH